MPGKHRYKESQSPKWPLYLAIFIIILGLAAAGWLLWDKYSGMLATGPSPRPDLSPQSTEAPVSSPTPSPTPTPSPSPSPTPTPTPPPIPDNGEDGYLSEGLYIWNNMAFELFYGSADSAAPYAQALSQYRDQLPGMEVYCLVVPNHSEFGLPERIRGNLGCGSQQENIASIYQGFSSEVHGVNIWDALNRHKDENIYYNTDTHWASLGAYYAYQEFCRQAGLEPVELELFSKTSYEGFTGYLYQVTGEECLAQHPDTIDLYEPAANYTAEVSQDGETFSELSGVNSGDESMGYGMFLWGDNPCMRVINHDLNTGRRILMVKESYGNAIGAFLAASFDQLYAVDFRSFEGDLPAYCQAWGITDVLFLNSTMAANTYARIEDLNSLFPGMQ